jgi:hypothetical protein
MVFLGFWRGFAPVHLSPLMKVDDTYVSASWIYRSLIVLKFEAQMLTATVYVNDGN